MKNCTICSKELTQTQIKYCSNNCKQKAHYNKNVKDNNNTSYYQFKRADKRKIELMNLKGGKCQKCGYNKNYSALHFHHLRDKLFNLDSRKIANTKMLTLLEEISKCELLCANCHAELHNPQCTLTN